MTILLVEGPTTSLRHAAIAPASRVDAVRHTAPADATATRDPRLHDRMTASASPPPDANKSHGTARAVPSRGAPAGSLPRAAGSETDPVRRLSARRARSACTEGATLRLRMQTNSRCGLRVAEQSWG